LGNCTRSRHASLLGVENIITVAHRNRCMPSSTVKMHDCFAATVVNQDWCDASQDMVRVEIVNGEVVNRD
jgi:hypothetical protein